MSYSQTFEAKPALPERIFDGGLQLMVVLFLGVSGSALYVFGWQYADTGGSFIEKLHPASLLSVALLLFAASASGNTLTGLLNIVRSHRYLVPYFLVIALLVAHSIFVVKLPFTVFIEVFLVPAIVFLLLGDLPPALARRLALLIHVLLFANAVLGLAELAYGFRLTPLVVNGELLEDEPRSTALLGHPLGNALLVGSYLLILALGGGRDLPAAVRPVCFVVNAASMVAFGGRAASLALILALVLLAARRFLEVARGATFDPRSVLAGIAVLPVLAITIFGLQELGFFSAFAGRIADDEGSASARIEMFELLRHVSWSELFFGPDPQVIATWSRLLGLDYGIENFILSYTLSYGAIATAILVAALIQFCRHVYAALQPHASWVFVYFFAVCMTSTSLSSKSTIFTVLVMLLMILLRPMRLEDQAPGQY